jgi:hypothetical protein
MSWLWRRQWSSHDDAARAGREQSAGGVPLPPGQAAAPGDESEAFVHGRLVEFLLAAGRPVPAWAVLNRLAHASLDELSELAAAGGPAAGEPPAGEPAWLRAQRSLAAALVAGATRPADLVSFQRAVLVPLELWVIERSRSEAVTSRHVIELAAEALSDYRPTG